MLTTPHCERLFLDEKFAIGQMFRKMGKTPEFALLGCGADIDSEGRRSLWRRYTLSMEGFEADITEVFPDRDMFVHGEAWLSKKIKHVPTADMYKVEGKAHVYAVDPVHRGTSELVSA